MDANFKQFAAFRLSREQMKGITGGKRFCTGTWSNSNGETISMEWRCSAGTTTGECINQLNAYVGHGQADSYDCSLV
jgi:hypothetical protein